MPSSYDHNTKVGNRGDVVKHPALIAAMEGLLSRQAGRPFLFADMYAGFGHHMLRPGSGQWEEGIGRVKSAGLPADSHRSIRHWFDWYLRPRPSLAYGTYPGSSVIALDVANSEGASVRVAAWDKSSLAIANLDEALGHHHTTYARSAKPTDVDVQRADFLFIDPPSPEHWFRIKKLLAVCANTLIWFPLHSKAGSLAPSADGAWSDAQSLSVGYRLARVQWDPPKRYSQPLIGCQLIYRFANRKAESRLQRVIDDVSRLTAWPSSWTVTHL